MFRRNQEVAYKVISRDLFPLFRYNFFKNAGAEVLRGCAYASMKNDNHMISIRFTIVTDAVIYATPINTYNHSKRIFLDFKMKKKTQISILT